MLEALARARRGWSGGRLELFRNLAILSGGQVVSKIIGFFIFAFLARTLGPEAYGAVEYVAGLTLFFATVVEGGLGVVGVRRIANHPGSLPGLAAQIPMARLALALISVPLVLLVAGPPTHGPAAARGLAWLFALSLLPTAWQQDWLLQATARMNAAALAQVVRMTVLAAIALAFVRGPADILVVGWAEIAALSAMSLYSVGVQQARITPFRVRAPMAGLAGLMREGALVGLAHSLGAATYYAPLLLVTRLMGGAQAAWYAAASRIVGSLLTFSNVYHFNLYPSIARATVGNRDELAALLAASFRVVAWGGAAVALALTVLAEPVCELVFGGRFGPTAPLLMIMAWMLPIMVLSGHARWSLVAAGFQSRVAGAQAAGLLAMAAIGAPAVVLLGARGAAWASVAAPVAVWLAAHAFAARAGGRLPTAAIALAPAILALGIIGGVQALGLHHWSAGLGVVVFAAAAPLVDRRLLSDLGRLGTARAHRSTRPELIG